MKRRFAAALGISFILGGCATSSREISAVYVSPLPYQGYNCQQLTLEGQRLQSRALQLSGRLDTAASNDKALAGVGVVLFWPALFALGGTKQQEAEYARLKGEYDAVQQVAAGKQCEGFALPAAVRQSPGTPAASTAS